MPLICTGSLYATELSGRGASPGQRRQATTPAQDKKQQKGECGAGEPRDVPAKRPRGCVIRTSPEGAICLTCEVPYRENEKSGRRHGTKPEHGVARGTRTQPHVSARAVGIRTATPSSSGLEHIHCDHHYRFVALVLRPVGGIVIFRP